MGMVIRMKNAAISYKRGCELAHCLMLGLACSLGLSIWYHRVLKKRVREIDRVIRGNICRPENMSTGAMAKNPKVFPAFLLVCWLSTVFTKTMTVQALPSPALSPVDDKLLTPADAERVMETDEIYGLSGVPQVKREVSDYSEGVGDFGESPENSLIGPNKRRLRLHKRRLREEKRRLRLYKKNNGDNVNVSDYSGGVDDFGEGPEKSPTGPNKRRLRLHKRRLRAEKRRLRLYKKNYLDNLNEADQENLEDLYSRDSRSPRLRFHGIRKRETTEEESADSGDLTETHEHLRKRRSVLSDLKPLTIGGRSRRLSINNDIQAVADMIIAAEQQRRFDEMDRLRDRLRKLGKRSDVGLFRRSGLGDDDVLSALKEKLDLALNV